MCHGVLYTITPTDWLRLLASEGVPFAYRPIEITAESYCGRRVQAMSLSAAPCLPLPRPCLPDAATCGAAEGAPRPSQRYLLLLRKGALEAGLAATCIKYLSLQRAPGSSPAPSVRPPQKAKF